MSQYLCGRKIAVLGRRIMPIWALLYITLHLCACISTHNVIVADVNPIWWSFEKQDIGVDFINTDSLTSHDLSLVVRYDETMPVGEFFINVECITPDSISFTEKLTLGISKQKKSCAPDYYEAEFLYRSGVVFSKKGVYRFNFTIPTAVGAIRGVSAIGMIITPIK